MIPPQEAAKIVAEAFPGSLPGKTLPLDDALGLVLNRDLVAVMDLPPFDHSAMDGFAVRASEAQIEREGLAITGESRAGATLSRLPVGSAIRILTGAPLPTGADAVVEQEVVKTEGGLAWVQRPVREGDNIRRAGSDVPRGKIALHTGTVLDARHLGLAAALGMDSLEVVPRPRVAILVTGDELVTPGAKLECLSQIYDSNGTALAAQVLEAGGLLVAREICPDDPDQIHGRLDAAIQSADVVLCTGGASVGRYDHIRAVLEEFGTVHFAAVAQQPGKPLVFATMAGRPVFGLSGNPVAAFVNFELYVRPLIGRLMARTPAERPRFKVELAEPIRKRPGKAFYARLRVEDGRGWLSGNQGSGRWSSLTDANALALLPPEPAELPAGTLVDAIWLDHGNQKS